MSVRESAIAMLEAMRNSPPDAIADDVRDTYPAITLEDAQRIKDGLLAIFDSKTRAEQDRRGREYKALHAELRKKYGKSGKR